MVAMDAASQTFGSEDHIAQPAVMGSRLRGNDTEGMARWLVPHQTLAVLAASA